MNTNKEISAEIMTLDDARELCAKMRAKAGYRSRSFFLPKMPCVIDGPTGGYIVTTHGWAEENGFSAIAW